MSDCGAESENWRPMMRLVLKIVLSRLSETSILAGYPMSLLILERQQQKEWSDYYSHFL